nr:trypsin eta-like [Cherax quadricarinatus]
MITKVIFQNNIEQTNVLQHSASLGTSLKLGVILYLKIFWWRGNLQLTRLLYSTVGLPSSVLQQVNVTVFKSEECDKSYSTLLEYSDTWPLGIGEETVCAGDRNGGRDSCQGDSGGPIVYSNSTRRYILAGIVSRGYGCGLLDYPGLYVNIRHPLYLAWIKNVAF